MTEKNPDIFKLVEEVEKQKKNSLDDIYDMLDEVKEGKEVKEETVVVNSEPVSGPSVVAVPKIPSRFGTYDTRFDCFKAIVEHTDYGKDNNSEYVSGHRDAIQKYYNLAYNNSKDLYVVEAKINDEISRFTSKDTVYLKGYYDGLNYLLIALNRSKDLLLQKVAQKLISELD